MELFNYGTDTLSVERQTFDVIKGRINITIEEFMSMPDDERNSWVDACRVAMLLEETNHDNMFLGYNNTDMYDKNGIFDLAAATEIIRNKKKNLDYIEKNSDSDLTVAQFILLGDSETNQLVNNVLKKNNLETAKELDSYK